METRTSYFKKEPHILIDHPRTYHIFMLRGIKSIFFQLIWQLVKFIQSQFGKLCFREAKIDFIEIADLILK